MPSGQEFFDHFEIQRLKWKHNEVSTREHLNLAQVIFVLNEHLVVVIRNRCLLRPNQSYYQHLHSTGGLTLQASGLYASVKKITQFQYNSWFWRLQNLHIVTCIYAYYNGNKQDPAFSDFDFSHVCASISLQKYKQSSHLSNTKHPKSEKINPYKYMRKSQERNLGDISALVWFYILPFSRYLRMAIITHCKSGEAYSWSISTFICPSDSDRNVRTGETAEV